MSPRPTADPTPTHENVPWDDRLPWIEVGTPKRRGIAPAIPAGEQTDAWSLAPTPVDPTPVAPTPVDPAPREAATPYLAPTPSDPAPSPAAGAMTAPLAPTSATRPAGTAHDAPTAVASPTVPHPTGPGATGPDATGPDRAGSRLGRTLDVIGPHLRPHRGALIGALGLLVVSVWLLVGIPLALGHAVRPPQDLAAVVLGLLIVLCALATAAWSVLLDRTAGRAATGLRTRLLDHLHRHGRIPGSAGPGLLLADVAAVRDLTSRTLPRIATGLLGTASLLVVLVLVAPRTALVVALTAGACLAVTALGRRRARRRDQEAARTEHALADVTDELLSASDTVRAYGLEARAVEDLRIAAERAAATRADARGALARTTGLAGVVVALGTTAALLLGEDRVLAVAATLLVAVLVECAVRRSDQLPGALAAGERLRSALAHRGTVTEHPTTVPLHDAAPQRGTGEITLSRLRTADGLFADLSATVPAGQHVALLDRDGHEGSALLSYLLRFEAPEDGTLLLDGQDISQAPIAEVRARLAVVQDDPALLTGTVRGNIRAGRPTASDDEVTEAARLVGAHEMIALLPDGYDTRVDPGDTLLTAGQRRLVAIARAQLRDAPVVLLDDAEAGLAPSEREPVRRALAALTAGRTTLQRSSDTQAVLAADRALYLESGELVEDGHPQQLAEDPDSWLSSWVRSRELASA